MSENKPGNRPKAGKGGTRGGRRRTSWPPGKSGNPKGRRPLPPEYKAAIKILEPVALLVLDEVMADSAHPRREQAAEYVLNRAHGTPTAKTQISTPPGKPLELKMRDPRKMTSEERRRLIAELEAKRREATAAVVLAGGDGAAPPEPDESEQE